MEFVTNSDGIPGGNLWNSGGKPVEFRGESCGIPLDIQTLLLIIKMIIIIYILDNKIIHKVAQE